MDKGALCASVLVGILLALALLPAPARADQNTDAYFVDSEFRDGPAKAEDSASYDYLWVRIALEANVSGFYNLTAELRSGQKGISTAFNNSFFAPGFHFMEVRFPDRDIFSSRTDGYYLANLSLRTPNFPRMPPVEGSYRTGYYVHSDFNPDAFVPYPPGSEYSYVDGANLTVSNSYLTFIFHKSLATMTYYYTRDEGAGRDGRFEVSFVRVLGWQAPPVSFFSPADTIYSAGFANASWRTTLLENGTHPLYGPFMRFNITYKMDLLDIRLGQPASVLEVTFSFYFTGNAHPSRFHQFTIGATTQAEMDITMVLSNTIEGSGLVLEQTIRDPTGNHDYLLRDQIGDFRYGGKVVKNVLPLSPRAPDWIPKVSFTNKWDGLAYAVYSWGTPAESAINNITRPLNIEASFRPEGKLLRLYTAYRTNETFISIDGVGFFGLESRWPPGTAPPPRAPERHDPLLYLLGSVLALAIIFLTMRLRTRALVREDEELERIEDEVLSEAQAEEPRPLSIEEKAIGEEDEWRRGFKQRQEAPPGDEPGGGKDGPPGNGGGKEVPP